MPAAHPSGFPSPCNDRGGQAPALRYPKPPLHRRARACPSPCTDRGGNGVSLRAFFARVGRSRGTGPRATVSKTAPFTVGRGPVPRRASIERETALVRVRFSRRSGDRGGQAPALRYNRNTASTADRSMSNRNPNSAIQPLPFQEMLHRPTAGNPRGNRLRPRIPP